MKFLKPRESRSRVEPDITAMVDVVFLLIIFFLTTSTLVERARAPVELPQEEGEEQTQRESEGIVINITAEGEVVVDQQTLSEEELLTKIDEEVAKRGDGDELEVLIRADKASALLHLNELAQQLMDRGVRGWRLATEVPRGASGTGGER